ncbi:MAG: T9SS type A sorting domain-containing protein [Fluviicola sp.]
MNKSALFFVIFLGLTLSFNTLNAQVVTVYEDDFTTGTTADGTANSATAFTSGSAPNNTSWRYSEFDTGWGISWNRTASNDELWQQNEYGSNESDFGCNMVYKGGNGYYTAPGGLYEQSASFSTNFTSNTQAIEWTFNFRSPEETPSGLTNGGAGFVGGAFVLGLTSPTLESAFMTTQGYAVIFGDASGNGNYVKLVRVNGGTTNGNTAVNNQAKYTFFNWNGTNSTSCIISDNVALTTSWYSIKVQYNPLNDEWRLFVRNDGGTKGDPQTLDASHCKGALIDNTYTGVNLPIMGLYACLPDDGTSLRTVRWDNIRIKQNVSMIGCPSTNGMCGAMTALPVELASMNLSCQNQALQLDWTTVSEVNSDYFFVERSIDGVQFDKIGQAKSRGNSNTENHYSFVDGDPLMFGTAYYRLKQVDLNGTMSTLGDLSSNDYCKKQDEALVVFPNPANKETRIVFEHEGQTEYSLELYNALGQPVFPDQQETLDHSGAIMIILQLGDLEEGVYHLRLNIGNKSHDKKVIIVH